MLQPVHEQLHITACLFTAEQCLGQQLLLRRVGGKSLGQRQLAADLGRVQRIIERIVEGLHLGDAQPVNHAFQRQALALPAGVGLQKDPLQIIPAVRPVFVQPDQKEILLQHRHIIKTPLGQLGVRPGPVKEFLQALPHRQTRVQIPLGQAGDLGDMVLQLAEDARPEVYLKGIQYIAARIDADRTNLNDFTAQRQLCTVIEEGFRLIADVPFQVENDQIHRSVLL